jgi:predicted dehydrogenase
MIKRYAMVGVSNRAQGMFMDSIREQYANVAELVAMLDSDTARMRRYNDSRKTEIPAYLPDEFDKMVDEAKPDVIIIATRDASHHTYVIKALKRNLEVICEKPLTTDEKKCREIIQAENASSAKARVTFNLRYVPHVSKIREIVETGKIGRVISVDLNWYLDTYHGWSYFNRWNRLREESGGLSITKACHHFDMVRWIIRQNAEEVFSYGKLNFYGPEGVHNPLKNKSDAKGRTCPTCDIRSKCKYYMRWFRNEFRNGDGTAKIDDHIDTAQSYTDYSPRMCAFDSEINIEDTYSTVMRFDGGAFLNYSLNASTPYEGYRLAVNGTEGRVECKELHAPLRLPFPANKIEPVITYIPMFGGREQIDAINLGGGHGGGDPLIKDELFIGEDVLAPVNRQAGLTDGVESVMMGIAVHQSATSGERVSVSEMRKRIFTVT